MVVIIGIWFGSGANTWVVTNDALSTIAEKAATIAPDQFLNVFPENAEAWNGEAEAVAATAKAKEEAMVKAEADAARVLKAKEEADAAKAEAEAVAAKAKAKEAAMVKAEADAAGALNLRVREAIESVVADVKVASNSDAAKRVREAYESFAALGGW